MNVGASVPVRELTQYPPAGHAVVEHDGIAVVGLRAGVGWVVFWSKAGPDSLAIGGAIRDLIRVLFQNDEGIIHPLNKIVFACRAGSVGGRHVGIVLHALSESFEAAGIDG